MRKCIICGRAEDSLGRGNFLTLEHIIPESLGNTTLKTFDVCKDCNSGLGANVDNYVCDCFMLKLIRMSLGIKSKSGKIPNPFERGKDEFGNTIIMNERFEPEVVPSMKQEGETLRVVAPSREEAKSMVRKRLERQGYDEKVIEESVKKIDEAKMNSSGPVEFGFNIEMYRLFMEALKIGYEFAALKIGYDVYIEDERALEIRKILKDAADGKFKEECPMVEGVAPFDGIDRLFGIREEDRHIVMLAETFDNALAAIVSLFSDPALTFCVLISRDARKYLPLRNDEWTEIVRINAES